ncbi:UNVERIFIED_CONTAM: DNA-binding protein, partial [Prevotella sp. 15_C9]
EIYSTLKQEKVISEASIRSGIPKGSLQAAWEAIGEVVKAWTTEGHSVALPGVGTMRFGLQAAAVSKVEDVGTGLITTRKVIFT